MAKNREYSYSDIKMLMASQKISESFIANQVTLALKRTDWTEQYSTGLKTRIALGFEKIGIDSKRDLRGATTLVLSIQKPSQEGLSFFKTQINDDFKKDPLKRTEILRVLGFKEHLREVQKGNQEKLVQMLFTFKTNMTPALRTEITAKGMTAESIDELIGYADTLKDANVTQELFKDTSKELTKEVVDYLNAIYSEVIGICTKASKIFKNAPLKRDQFNFRKVVKNLGTPPPPKTTTPPSTNV